MGTNTTDLSLRAQIHGLGELLRLTLDTRIEVVVEVADGCPDCAMSWPALRGALVALAANARDAMPEGGKLTVQARPSFDSARGGRVGWVAVSVADTGFGMTVDTRERATDAGFTTKIKPRGGGHGLTLAAALAQRSGGTLAICSAPGIGTVVTLFLPRA